MLVSFMALQMQSLAQNYLVYQLTGLSSAIGYVSAAFGIASLTLSFFGGVVADRIGRRKLLVVTQLGMALLALLIGLLITLDLIQVWHIVVTAIALGAISSFNLPARQSYVPDIVGVRNLASAMAVNSGITNLTRIAGPALAGILIGAIGVGSVYYIKAGAYLVFMVLLLMIPVAGKSLDSGRNLAGDAVDCLRYLRRDARLRDLLILAVAPTILGTPYIFFLPVFQEAVFHVGPVELGWMMTVVGIGAVIGALVIAFLNKHPHKGGILLGSGIGFGASLVLFALTSSSGDFAWSLVTLALTGLTSTAFTALGMVMILTVTLPEMRGRVMGVYLTSFGLTSLGAFPIGALCDMLGAPLTTGIFGGLTLLSVVIMLALRPAIARL
jgi:MFS family permease